MSKIWDNSRNVMNFEINNFFVNNMLNFQFYSVAKWSKLVELWSEIRLFWEKWSEYGPIYHLKVLPRASKHLIENFQPLLECSEALRAGETTDLLAEVSLCSLVWFAKF